MFKREAGGFQTLLCLRQRGKLPGERRTLDGHLALALVDPGGQRFQLIELFFDETLEVVASARDFGKILTKLLAVGVGNEGIAGHAA